MVSQSPAIVITPCSWSDSREQLLKVRIEVFVEEQSVPLELEEDNNDVSAQHWLAQTAEGTPIGCVRLVSNNGCGKVGRLAVLKAWRSGGIAQQLMAATEHYARHCNLTKLTLGAQLHAEGFYHTLGYSAVGSIFDDAGIAHRTMVKILVN